MRIHCFFLTIAAFTFMSVPAFGCTCVSPPPDAKTAHDFAKWYTDRSDAVFEGSVKRIELKSALMDAKVGGLVPANLEDQEFINRVTFDLSHSYKGVVQKDVELTTGVGGGDCGFDFESGKQYLVFAFADTSGHLSTGICSGTGLLEDSQSELSYLRGEKVISETPKQNASVPPTKFCGHIAARGINLSDSQVFLIRVGNKSPIPSEEAEIAPDGSFCFVGARPGKYYMAFISRDEDSPTSFVLFPGAANSSDSRPIELKSEQVHSDLKVVVEPQPTFSVSGNILIPKNSALPTECKVFLLNADPLSFLVSYSVDVDPSGSFEFRRVLPGRYWTFVGVDSDAAPNWLTRKAEVEVNATVSGLSLELVRK